jgi:signal transduction histidine kinase/CheY-like chemotaxis protein
MTTKTETVAAALGIAVFERRAEGLFALREPAPAWLGEFDFHDGDDFTESFPFLEIFLPDAEEHWAGAKTEPLYSDVWTQTGRSGQDRHLRAAAATVGGAPVLCIEHPQSLYGETQAVVQHAHDTALAYERIAKLSRALADANEELAMRNREVQRATQAKSEFLARMSHEIRTPLNAILGMAELLWESPLAPEQREYVRIFRRGGENLLNLLNDILDLSKVEAGHLELENVEFDLAEVLEKAAEIIAVRAHAKGLELSCRIAPDVPLRLKGDPDRLRQVVLNLLGNAVKFTERGEVGICVAAGGEGALRFEVFDTGIGIPQSKLGAIFESFTQAETSTSRKYGGTGLGLAISKKFVELMGGEIWAESVEGQGSAFIFTPRFEVLAASPGPPELVGTRWLLADDSRNHRAAVRDLLAGWGALVTEAVNGAEALSIGAAEPFDWMLLDARMPVMDGFEAAAQRRGDGRVLLMITTERPADAVRCRELGARPVLKPLRRSELLECVRFPERNAAESQPAARGEPGEFTGLRILLADDSEDNRFLIRRFLQASGCALEECDDGASLVRKFQEGAYSLVLADVQMPLMDGYTATRTMRAWERERGAARTPILALTAHAMQQETQKSLDAGCDAHLTKPISKATLLDAIRRFAVRRAAAAAGAARGFTDVVVDSSLEDIVPGYLENRRKDVGALREALESGDFARIRVLGHNMKGSGAGYGFAALTELGAALEKAALAGEGEAVRSRIDELGAYLESLRIQYE